MSRLKPLRALELLYNHTAVGGVMYEMDTQCYNQLKKTLEAFEIIRKHGVEFYNFQECRGPFKNDVFEIGIDPPQPLTKEEYDLLKSELEWDYRTEYDNDD